MGNEAKEKVLELIDRRKGSIIAFLQKLVSFPSVTGEEWEIQNYIAGKLGEMGLETDIWEPSHAELSSTSSNPMSMGRGPIPRPLPTTRF